MKLLIIWSISAFLFVSTCGASSTDEHGNNESFIEILTDAERAWVEKGEPLTYVYDPDWPPFEWKDENDNHTGIIADLLELLLEKTGLNLIPSHTNTWSESVALVREGKADMFSAVTVTEERKQFLDFTAKDIYTYPAVLVTQFDDYEVYLDLEKDALLKTIAVVKDSGLGQYIKESFPKNTYVEVPSTKRGFAAVVDGDADLFAINAVTARYFIEKKYQSEIKIATKLDFTYSLKVASHQNLPPEVISILEKALNTISGDEQDAIFKRWTSVEKRREVSWEVVVRVSVAFLIILALLGWHNIKLKKLVNQRTRELSKSKDRLELKVEHRTKELKQAMQDAKNANHTKDEFLASMSHELRTPLTSIIGNAEYLDEKLTTPELLEVVSHIQGAGQAQLSLVSDILDMSKIDSGKFSIDEYPYNLSQLLKDIGGMLSIRVEDAGLLLLIDQKNEEKFELLGDSQRIGQILINIIGNAIKFTEQGEIRLTTKRDEQEQWLLFEVQDTGVGMTPEEQSHLLLRSALYEPLCIDLFEVG
jgi:polar amino acid transport system substrate-binding protein